MDWKSLGEQVAKISLPLLGAVLPLPGGAAIGTALAAHIGAKDASPQSILDALTAGSEAVQKAKEFEATHQETMLNLHLNYEIEQRKADSADIESVNKSIQAEANASATENWFQKGWRPFNGYVLGLASLIAVIFVCILFYDAMTGKDAASIAAVIGQIPSLATAIAMILAVPGAAVGITAWHRGVVQQIQAQNEGQ